MNFLRSIISFLQIVFYRSPIEQSQEKQEEEFVFPIPKPHEIDPIYFTLLHKCPQHPDILLKWIFTEISSMEDGWERLSAYPVELSRELKEKAEKDVELKPDITGLNGTGWSNMICELRNLTITGFPAKYLLRKD